MNEWMHGWMMDESVGSLVGLFGLRLCVSKHWFGSCTHEDNAHEGVSSFPPKRAASMSGPFECFFMRLVPLEIRFFVPFRSFRSFCVPFEIRFFILRSV